jgi:hypothetical protein
MTAITLKLEQELGFRSTRNVIDCLPHHSIAARWNFQAGRGCKLNRREKKRRFMLKLEKGLGFRFHKKNYKSVR